LRQKALKWYATVISEVAAEQARQELAVIREATQAVQQLPAPTFDWQRDYAQFWSGNDGSFEDLVFGPGPDDLVIIDGVRVKYKHHLDGTAKERAARESAQNNAVMQQYMGGAQLNAAAAMQQNPALMGLMNSGYLSQQTMPPYTRTN
jgi:hypothetical protein